MKYTALRRQHEQNKKYPNFQDLFSMEDIDLVRKVKRTHNSGLSRIVLCVPDQRCDYSTSVFSDSSSMNLHCLTLKLKYAMDVWAKAVLLSGHQNPSNLYNYWNLHWEDNDTSFRHIEYSDFHSDITVQELLSGFWSLLESIADSGEIKVSEGLHMQCSNSKWNNAKPIISCELVVDASSGRDVYNKTAGNWPERKEIYNYPFDKTPRSYKWVDIKDMFIELTLEQLRLMDPRQMLKHTEYDDALFLACRNLDIEAIRFWLERGANINAINEYGNTPLYYAISSQHDHFLESEKEYTEDEKKELQEKGKALSRKVVAYLLEQGADIDLYGYDGMQPLCEAYYCGDVELVRFLLEKGANPNYNSYLDDGEEHVCCTPLHCIFDEYDPLTPEQKEIEKLLYQYGGRIFRWGYNPRSRENEGKCFVWMEPHQGYSLFSDADRMEVGDCHSLTVEKENGETETIDLSDISDILSEWERDYLKSMSDDIYSYLDLWIKGKELVINDIAPRLPEYVALYYTDDSLPITKGLYSPHYKMGPFAIATLRFVKQLKKINLYNFWDLRTAMFAFPHIKFTKGYTLDGCMVGDKANAVMKLYAYHIDSANSYNPGEGHIYALEDVWWDEESQQYYKGNHPNIRTFSPPIPFKDGQVIDKTVSSAAFDTVPPLADYLEMDFTPESIWEALLLLVEARSYLRHRGHGKYNNASLILDSVSLTEVCSGKLDPTMIEFLNTVKNYEPEVRILDDKRALVSYSRWSDHDGLSRIVQMARYDGKRIRFEEQSVQKLVDYDGGVIY